MSTNSEDLIVIQNFTSGSYLAETQDSIFYFFPSNDPNYVDSFKISKYISVEVASTNIINIYDSSIKYNYIRFRKIFYELTPAFIDWIDLLDNELMKSSFVIGEFIDFIKRFVLMFEVDNSRTKYIGIFGELLFIYFMKITNDIDLSKYYQKKPDDPIDFVIGKLKVDIKTSMGRTNKIHITNNQLQLQPEMVFVNLIPDGAGISLTTLFNVLLKFGMNFSPEITMLIESITESRCFNLEASQVFLIDKLAIPKLANLNLPPNVVQIEVDVIFLQSQLLAIDELCSIIKKELSV